MNTMKLMYKTAVIVLLVAVFGLNSFMAASAVEKQPLEVETAVSIPVETTLTDQGVRRSHTVWLEMINGAKSSLDFELFYLAGKDKDILDPIIDAVIKAADRGVRVRFLVGPVNKSMRKNTVAVLDRFKNHKGISHTFFDWRKLTGGIQHAKYFIVDRKEVFVGSQNFDWRAMKHIHETGLRIKHPAIAEALHRIFEADWLFNNGDKTAYEKLKQGKPLTFPKNLYLVSTPAQCNPPGVKTAIDELIHLIDAAKKKITIQLLKFHEDVWKRTEDWTLISDALTKAAKRGVTVKMLISNWQIKKPGLAALKKLAKEEKIHVKIVTIPDSKTGFIPYARVIHSKVMRIDDMLCWVGTSNWGYGYFYNSRNVEVVTRHAETAAALDRLFLALWTSTYAVPVEKAD